ncbi:hypothetical protein HDU67_004371 [Dinochytrium kinnereticum]|nr:hypothetical protein HDU67_004371 [Dinochytrium kinnereticum]
MALIQGSSRGIGLALVKRLLAETDGMIVSTSRHPEVAKKNLLEALNGSASSDVERRVHFLNMDVTNESSISDAAAKVKSTLGDRPLRLLVNCAGHLNPEKALSQITHESLLEHLSVNLIGPVLVMKHFSTLFAAPSKDVDASGSKSLQSILPKPICANISARTGSIGDNRLGGWYSYRISKAGLNQATRTASVELGRKGILTVSLHPGTVDTELSRKFVKNAPHVYPPDESAHLLWTVMRGLKEADNGGFFDQNGKPIVW